MTFKETFHHSSLRVKLGDAKRSDPAQEIDVSKIIAHKKYEPSPRFTNDIALLKLSREYKSGGNDCLLNIQFLYARLQK